MMGRPVTGPALIDRLDGGDRAKLIVRTVLETIAGTRTIESAGAVIDCNQAYVHVLRDRLLTAMVAAAEPRPHGPPPTPDPDPALADALAEAKQRAADAQIEVEFERCRTELALVLGPRLGGKKNRRRQR